MNSISAIIDLAILIALLGIWIPVCVMTYEFYTTGKRNRFKFRFWFSIGMLNLFHILLAILFKFTGNPTFQEARWLAFILIDAMLLEIFIYPLKQRTSELVFRVIYYFSLIMDQMSNHPFFLLINISLLIYLASKSEYPEISKHFKWTFVIYYGVVLVPYISGYTQTWSLLIGLLYSFHVVLGVKKLYICEQVDEYIREEMLQEELSKEAE